MSELYAGKCIYCGNQVFYQSGETLVKCRKCRENLVVAEFIHEQQRMEAALAEGEQARKALREAEAERDQAREQLLQTVTTIEGLKDGQEESRERLKQVLEKQDASQESQEAALTLLNNLYTGQYQNLDILSSLFRQAMSGQKTAEEKLYTLQSAAEKISNAQNDIGTLLRNVSEYLDTDIMTRNKQIGDLVTWAQSSHVEDTERLEAISRSAGELAAGQKEINQQISELQGAVIKTEQAVYSLEKKWQQSELRKLTEWYQQAENCQLDREFEQAEKLYQQVIIQGGKDPEVYWRMLLCHYCVVYQRDNEGNRILTILYPDLTDPSEMTLWKELKNCEQTPEQREYYQKEQAKLEQVINRYREVRLDRQYDVFISVKQTVWRNGEKFYTADNKAGMMLYQHLSNKLGLRVFNSEAKDCKCPAGQEWEPYILAALLSSKVMIVVGTCPEYMESQWVRNEWQRYQWLQKKENEKGKSERKLLCYISESMNAYDIPKGLNPDRQAIVNNANAFEALDEVMKEAFPKILKPKEEWKPRLAPSPMQTEESLASVLAKMQAWLNLDRFERVLEVYDQLVIDGKFLDSCTLHLYALCGSYRVREISKLRDYFPQILQAGDGRFDLAQKCARTEQEQHEISQLINMPSREKTKEELTEPKTDVPIKMAEQKKTETVHRYGDADERVAQTKKEKEQQEQKQEEIKKLIETLARIAEQKKANQEKKGIRTGSSSASGKEKAFPPSSPYEVGSIIKFGKYQQSGKSNGKELIEWIVLDVDGQQNRVLLLSKYGLDVKAYNKTTASTTWENCSLRKWLNEEFLQSAFSPAERFAILETTVDNSPKQGYPFYMTNGGNDTGDRLFLLSYHEAFDQYAIKEQKGICLPTDYAMMKGIRINNDFKTERLVTGFWWLRSPGERQNHAIYVNRKGVRISSETWNEIICVRPAFWLNLEADIL